MNTSRLTSGAQALMSPHDRRVPASYWLTAGIGSIVLLFCYGTTRWYPHFAAESLTGYPVPWPLRSFLFPFAGGVLALLAVAGSLLALRWAWVGVAIVLLPWIPSLLDDTPLHFGVFVGLGSVALTASWRRPWASVAAVGAAILVLIWWIGTNRTLQAPVGATVDVQDDQRTVIFVVYLAALLLVLAGAFLLRRSALREEQRRALAQRSEAVEEQSAVVAERARLARDLHDVVAHHVSLIAVRAETAPYTEKNLSPGAKGLLTEIAADARLALDELRGVLGILGRSGDDPARAPQPGWGDIASLVERARTSGQEISVAGGLTGVVTPATGYAAYRVVQEALTNARKHAAGEPARLELSDTGRLVRVRVANSLSAGGAGRRATGHGAGQGLVGMRERVTALGGTLQAGPRDAEFVVEAHLPQGTP